MNPHTKKILILLFAPALFFICSCAKESKKNVPDLSNPVINITNPVKNGSKNSLDPITIIGTATDNNLALLSVKVFNVTDTTILYQNSQAISGGGVTINQSYFKYITAIKSCLLQVIVKDGAGNTTVDSVRFAMY
jgi:hypothetical protein